MRTPRLIAVLLCLALLGTAAFAQAPATKPKPATPQTKPAMPIQPGAAALPKVDFEKYILPNGLQVILHVDHKLPMVNVNEWYHVGSGNERMGRTGFAHLFEHMMFQGSKNAAGEYFEHAEKAGANLREGGVNGTTNTDRTNYFITVPSANLEYVLWLEADRLATLIEVTDQAKLDNQRAVVKNERRQGLENTPYGRWYALVQENLFPAGHPYQHTTIGSMEDLSAASLDDVKDFFRRYYSPNNLTLVIAGDFDKAQAKELIAKYFGSIPPGPPLDRPKKSVVVPASERLIEVNDRVPQERVYLAWVTPAYFDKDDAELDLASRILTDGLSARLNRALVYDKQLCTQVNSFTFGTEQAGIFVAQATARPGASLKDIEAIISQEIAKLAKSGPTVAELQRAKNKFEYDFVTGLERIGGFGGKADLLAQYNTFVGEPNLFEADLNRYRTATVAGVQAAVAKWLDTRNRVLVRFHPEKSGRPQTTVDRAQLPTMGTDRPFSAPEVKTAKLKNGLDIVVVERHDLPKTAVRLLTRSGAVHDPQGKDGVANMMIRTIDMGTPTRKALDIEDALGDLGTSLSGSAGRESAVLGFEVLQRNIDGAMGIFSDVVLHPVFPETEVERERKRQLDTIAQQEKNPNAIAGRIQAMIAFGPNHPYGRPVGGLTKTVSGITRADIAEFHKSFVKPGSSALVFAGDITLAQATALAEKYFGGWTGGAAPAVDIPAPQPMARGGKLFMVDRPDSAQTVVAHIIPAPQRVSDDYYPLQLANTVYGSMFGSRLNLNLREDKGYSYGAFSNLAQYSKAGMLVGGAGVQTDKTKESVVEFVAEMKNLGGAKPISDKELEFARANRIRGYAQQFEALARVADQVGLLWIHNLPYTELQREPAETQKATVELVNSTVQKYAKPGEATLLLVGDLSKIQAGVQSLNLGEIVILDVEGNPVHGGGGTGNQ